MSEDTTQEIVETAPEEGQVVEAEVQGVEAEDVQPEAGTDQEGQESREAALDAEAEASLFRTLTEKKGLDPNDPTTIEKVAKMAMEAESQLTRKSQEASREREEREAVEFIIQGLISGEITAEDIAEDEEVTPTQPTPQPKTDPYYEKVRKMEARDDLRVVMAKHPDLPEVKEIMKEIGDSVADKSIFEGVNGLELLYRLARTEKYEQDIANAEKAGADKVTQAEIDKVRATVADGTKSKTAPVKAFTREQIANMTLEEYEANEAKIKEQIAKGLIK